MKAIALNQARAVLCNKRRFSAENSFYPSGFILKVYPAAGRRCSFCRGNLEGFKRKSGKEAWLLYHARRSESEFEALEEFFAFFFKGVNTAAGLELFYLSFDLIFVLLIEFLEVSKVLKVTAIAI